jgi:hypothetical protein
MPGALAKRKNPSPLAPDCGDDSLVLPPAVHAAQPQPGQAVADDVGLTILTHEETLRGKLTAGSTALRPGRIASGCGNEPAQALVSAGRSVAALQRRVARAARSPGRFWARRDQGSMRLNGPSLACGTVGAVHSSARRGLPAAERPARHSQAPRSVAVDGPAAALLTRLPGDMRHQDTASNSCQDATSRSRSLRHSR